MALNYNYPVESLLRPPVEIYSAATAAAAAIVAGVAPWALLMTPEMGFSTAAILGGFAAYRARDAVAIVRYHRAMRKLPRYTLTADQIPVSNSRLFLGRGFAWTQKHTQRLRDTLRPEVQGYVTPSMLYRFARKKEVAWEHAPLFSAISRAMANDVWWNPVRPLPPVGGRPALHAVEWEESNVTMPLGERVGHLLVLGTTRVGKTRLAEILITQDIRRGEIVICFDPKGDAELMRRMYAESKRAGREFYVFHLGYPELSARYNGVGSFQRISEVATRTARQLSGEGNSAAFREFAWRFVNIVARCLVALGQRPSYDLILRYVTNIEPLFLDYFLKHFLPKNGPANWNESITDIASKLNDKNMPFAFKGRDKTIVAIVQYVTEQRMFDAVGDGLVSAVRYDKTYFDKITASLLPLLEKLTTGKIAELLSPDYFDLEDDRPIFDWMQVIRKNAVVYVGLDALTDSEVSTAVGNSMLADLVSNAGLLYKHGVDQGLIDASEKLPKLNLHCDEVNELMGDEFIPMVNKGGGAGLQVTAYTQTLSDIEVKVGSKAKSGQVQGNFNNLIMMRVKEYYTAELLTKQLSKVEVNFLVQVSGVNDTNTPFGSGGFTSKNEDRISSQVVPMIEPADIMALPKGQAFALIEGGRLWKIRMPLPSTKHDPHMPKNLADLAARMEKDYRTGESWWTSGQTSVTPAQSTTNYSDEEDATADEQEECAASPVRGGLEDMAMGD